ncbi:di-trans,poly-cis-decaprenylcistransferase [Bacteriovorax stolpii]|uniref:Isoprenyl transferase n=2 Tax=Bacteriovorax stolpii TaxID=960 RepID=A0A2K9NYW8_BACTC|nr:di-trans,poly-cis-decaprenylcistransferase [Bacteriovorax stolpii]QDK43658.1 di-trans,poly-cis-decaprenylcistransferase [Bacteriovorax stolpii]
MDGNGRWAKQRSHPRVWGHVRGSAVVSTIVEEADNLGIEALTMYAFSSENWSRPQTEVRVLFNLLFKFLKKERERILKNNIRFRIMGDVSNLPEQTKKLIAQLEGETAHHTGLKLTFAFGYGARSEIAYAVNRFMKANPGKEMSEDDLNEFLMIPDLGDVDLLIRTGGDHRVSNFMLWQIAYAEMFFTETKWPDFTVTEFRFIIEQVAKRERRFGAIAPTANLETNVIVARENQRLIRG